MANEIWRVEAMGIRADVTMRQRGKGNLEGSKTIIKELKSVRHWVISRAASAFPFLTRNLI